MNRNEFYDIYQHKPGGITKSGQAFIDRIFFPVWEEYGLDFIEPEEDFISGENNKYRIDFIIKTPYKHYLIEVNDYSSHAGNPDAFDKHTKKMDDTRQSILEDSYQCKYIDREIEIKPVLIGITDKEIENNPQRVVDRLNRSFVGDEYLNLLRFSKFEGGIQLLPFQQETLNKINASRDRGDRRGLISLTTGIGKTFISIFHAKHYGGKVLFLAHLILFLI